MEENHTFQFTPLMDGNESQIPTIASLPETPSEVPDRSTTARTSTTHSRPHCTLMEPNELMQWNIPSLALGFDTTNQLSCIYQCVIES